MAECRCNNCYSGVPEHCEAGPEWKARAEAVEAERDILRARLAAVEAFCRDYPRSAKYPDYEGGYESALDDVLEVIDAAREEETR